MRNDREEITAHTLHAELERRGCPVSPSQLERWRGSGLIPMARQQGAGRGSVVYYSAASVDHVERAAHLVSRPLSIRDARWRLWCEGWPIEPGYWRPELEGATKFIDGAIVILQSMRDGDEGAWEALAQEVFTTRQAPRAFRRLRKDVGQERFAETLDALFDIAAGQFTGLSSQPDGADVDHKRAMRGMDVALGLQNARRPRVGTIPALIKEDYSGILVALSKALGTEPLASRLERFSDAALQQAARQFTQIADCLTHASQMAVARSIADGLGFRRGAMIVSTDDAPSSALLIVLWALYQADQRVQSDAAAVLQELVAIARHERL